jgi:phosphatidate cytidylyltransferase
MSRVISALALIPIVVSIIWFLPLGTVLLAQVILCAAFFEYANLAEKSGSPFPRSISVVAALSTCAAFSLVPSMLHIVLMVSVVSIATIYLVQGQFKQALSAVSASMFAVVYLAVPIGSLVSLRITFGPEVVILLLLSVVASDTAQYYGGRLFGRRSLAAVSPNKTVEGAVFGIAASVIVMWLVGRWWLLFGMAIAGFGIAGDLFESSLKRNAHVKDASELIPGHGGVLDRIDGLLFAAPVYYTVIQLIR